MKTILIITSLALLLLPLNLSANEGELAAQIKADHVAHPHAKSMVQELRGEAIKMDAGKRGRYAMVGRVLESVGPEIHWALVEDLLADKGFGEVRESARTGWRVGILHTLGRARNPEYRAAYVHVLNVEKETEVIKAAARALGNLQDAEAAKTLTSFANVDGEKGLAVVAGMGTCRRSVMATYLATRLDQSKTSSDALALTLALREIGNSYAWKTSIVSKSGEGDAVRAIAAKSLVKAFVRFPEQESEIIKAILIVDASQTKSLIESARKDATKPTKARLGSLAKRVEASPLH